MIIRRDVKNFALTCFIDRSDDPTVGHSNLEPTPQLFRISWQIRRDIECRTIHVAAQRFSLARASRPYDHHWLVATFNQRSIREVQRVIAYHRKDGPAPSRQVRRRNRSKMAVEMKRLMAGRDHAEQQQARSSLIDEACEDYRNGPPHRKGGGRTAQRRTAQELPESNIASLLRQAIT